MIGLDEEIFEFRAGWKSEDFPKTSETITAKTVASPYFTANDFAFAYARA